MQMLYDTESFVVVLMLANDPPEGDYSSPLQLLAQSLEFTDPLTGERRHFESARSLQPLG